ncbi:tetratricopeptide repeat protein [Kitasatospora sp. NPDC087314]|uniref:tetratricopeptide repeat protein n=1 Tax=Kitasatospora sp. NPDC087314 TaxID=3364068 RepID=UPI0037FD4C9B
MTDALRLATYEWVTWWRSSGESWRGIARLLSDTEHPWTPQGAHQAFRRPPKRIRAEAETLVDGRHRDALFDLMYILIGHFGVPGTFSLLTWETDALVLEARTRGCGWQEIATSLACSRQYAHRTYRDLTPDRLTGGDMDVLLPPVQGDADEEDEEEFEESYESLRRARVAASVLEVLVTPPNPGTPPPTRTTTSPLRPNHPDILAARSVISQWRREAGDEATYTELLPDRIRGLRRSYPNHSDALAARDNLARSLGRAGDAAGATAAYAELLPDMARALGPKHRDTLIARGNLAHWRGQAGDAAGAAAAFAALLPDLVRVLGPDRRFTLDARRILAESLGRAGDAAGAAAAFAELLPDMARVLGPDHSDTLAARENLAHWRMHASEADVHQPTDS